MKFTELIEEIKKQLPTEDVKNKIACDLGISLKNNKCLCFLHREKHPSMSFDEKHKRFKCFSCGQTYDVFNHYMQYYNMGFVEAAKRIIDDYRLNIQYQQFRTDRKLKIKPKEHNKDLKSILQYLNLRKISESTAAYVGLKEDKGTIVFEYRNELGEHVANKYRPAHKVQKGAKMWFQEGTNINTLFNMDKVDISKSLVITEGEFDCLSLIECGIKNSVSIPTGANSNEWVETNYSWLEQFKEIIIWFDNDNPGIEGMRNIAARLPNDIVKTVYSKKAKDINELLYRYGNKVVLEELERAEEPPINNIVSPYEVEDFNVYEAEKIKSGIQKLDDIIYGFVLGTLNVLTGYNGSGKSTLINQMCIAESISQGYKTFVYSGELTRPNLMYWLIQTLVIEDQLMDLTTKDGKKYKKASNEAKKMIKSWLNNKLFLYNNDFDVTSRTLLNTMEKLAKRKNVKCFVLDNLMTIDLECKAKEELMAQKDFVRELKKFAIKYDAVVHLVAHPRKGDENLMVSKMDVCGSGDITNLSDYVTAIHRYTKEQKEKQKHDFDNALLLFKNRPTGRVKENGIGLYYSDDRRRFYRDTPELLKDYGYTKGHELIQVEIEECPF